MGYRRFASTEGVTAVLPCPVETTPTRVPIPAPGPARPRPAPPGPTMPSSSSPTQSSSPWRSYSNFRGGEPERSILHDRLASSHTYSLYSRRDPVIIQGTRSTIVRLENSVPASTLFLHRVHCGAALPAIWPIIGAVRYIRGFERSYENLLLTLLVSFLDSPSMGPENPNFPCTAPNLLRGPWRE